MLYLELFQKASPNFGSYWEKLKKYKQVQCKWSFVGLLLWMNTSEWAMELDWHTEVNYLHGNWVYCCSNFKTSLFKHHDWRIVDAGSCEKEQTDHKNKEYRVVQVPNSGSSVTTPSSHCHRAPELKHQHSPILFFDGVKPNTWSYLPSGNISMGSFVLSFTWSFNLEKKPTKVKGNLTFFT